MTVEELLVVMRKVIENARDLVDEAELLLSHGKFARAFTLAHLATEEMSKAWLVSGLATAVVYGQPVDWKKVGDKLRDHTSKIVSTFLMDYMRTPQAGDTPNVGGLLARICNPGGINKLKNDSLYTSLKGVKPSEAISPELAIEYLRTARELLVLAELGSTQLLSATGMTESGLTTLLQMPEMQHLLSMVDNYMPPMGQPGVAGPATRDTALAALLNDPRMQLVQSLMAGAFEQHLAIIGLRPNQGVGDASGTSE